MQTIRRIILDNEIKTIYGNDGIYSEINNSSLKYKLLPPVEPNVIVCVHLNYKSRLNELRRVQPDAPTYFLKPTSCINSHLGEVIRPLGCKFLNYEGEIALVVGKTAKNIDLKDAGDYILAVSYTHLTLPTKRIV